MFARFLTYSLSVIGVLRSTQCGVVVKRTYYISNDIIFLRFCQTFVYTSIHKSVLANIRHLLFYLSTFVHSYTQIYPQLYRLVYTNIYF